MTVHKEISLFGNASRLFCVGLLAVLCLLPVFSPVMAEDILERPDGTVYTDETTGYKVEIHDDASLLKDSELHALAEDMKGLTKYGSAGFFTTNIGYRSTSALAHDLYDKYLWKQSSAEESGTLFLIDMAQRNIYIYSNGVIYKTITNAYANTITDKVYKYASDADYYRCAKEVYNAELTLLEGKTIAQPMKNASNLFLAAALAVLINYFLVKLFSRSKSPSEAELLASIDAAQRMNHVNVQFERESKTYSPRSSSGSGGGGGHSGGGGSSGGGGGHSF